MTVQPARLRRVVGDWARPRLDALVCSPIAGLERFGSESPWVVCTRLLNRDSIVYSAGVGKDISFEKELVKRFGLTIELFDPSPTGVATMERDGSIDGIRFHALGIAGRSGVRGFRPPVNPAEGSFSLGTEKSPTKFACTTVRKWMRQCGHERLDLIKMDIEGFEYEVLDDVLSLSPLPQQICVEFHPISRLGRLQVANAILRVKRIGYRLVNKCRGDCTFVRLSAPAAKRAKDGGERG